MTVRYELRKMLLKQYGLWLLLTALLLKILSLFSGAGTDVLNMSMETHKTYYLNYMQVLSGALDDEKQRYIEQEAQAFADAERTFQKTEQQLLAGECTEYEFLQAADAYRASREKQEAFTAVQGQYLAAQHDAQKYLMYTNGWSVLLAGSHADWILILLICLLSAPVVCTEHSSGMAQLLAVTKNGRSRLYRSKLAAILIAAAAATLVLAVTEGVFVHLRYGLCNGDYPLRSIPQFAETEYRISCIQAALLIAACRLLGAIWLAVIVFCASVLLKRAVPSVFAGVSSVLLPMLLLANDRLQFIIPLPAAMLHSDRFLQGSFRIGSGTAQTVITLTKADFLRTVCLTGALCGICGFLGAVRPKAKRLSALLLCLPLLTACTAQKPFFADRIYNSADPLRAGNAQYTAELKNGVPVLRAADGTETPLIRTPFPDTATVAYAALDADADAVYRLECISDLSVGGLSLYTEQIVRTALSDFRETVIYRREILSDPTTALLGLGAYLPYPDNDDAERVRRFAVFGDELLMQKDSGLWRIPIGKTDGEMLADGQIRAWCCAGDCVYYISGTYQLHRLDLNTRADAVCCGEPVSDVRTDGESICAQSITRKNTVLTKRMEESEWTASERNDFSLS